MRTHVGGLLLLCLAVSPACDSSTPNTAAEFAFKQYERYAQRVAECTSRDEATLLSNLSLDDVKRRVDNAQKKKRLAYDRDAAKECFKEIESLDCSALSKPFDFRTGTCIKALVGQLEVGSECYEFSDFNECAGSAFCNAVGSCTGVCSALVGVGGGCGSGISCVPGTQCLNGICRERGKEGTTCLGNSQLACASDLACLYGDTSATGTCSQPLQTGMCRFDLQSGTDFLDCARGYQCQIDASSNGACARSLGAGESCSPGHNQCAATLSCREREGGFFCTAPSQLGETCGFFGSAEGQVMFEIQECLDSYCDFTGQMFEANARDFPGVCAALKAEGEACAAGECMKGTRCDGVTETCVAACPLR
jgi:hypothetical protein